MKKALVIGGGFGGCTAVHELKRLGDWYVTLVDPSNELGAGVRTRFYCGHPYTFGPRHFLTQNEHVYEYLLKHLDLRLCKEHQFITFVESDSQFYNYPIHYDDIKRMPDAASVYKEIGELEELYRDATFNLTTGSPLLERNSNNYEDFWVRSVGPTLYKKFIDKYTKKMWMIDNNSDIDDFSWSPKGVAIKYGGREGWDKAISAYPTAPDGYNSFFDNAALLCDEFIQTKVTCVQPHTLCASINGLDRDFDLIINTSPLDDLFNHQFGSLKYIGRHVEFSILPVEYALPKHVYFAYYAGSEAYTRIVEYKKFTCHSSPYTLISHEYPSSTKGKYYPMPTEKYRVMHQDYVGLCHSYMHNVGRIGLYNYRYDIDDVIEQVLNITSRL